jgi:hypothetical protein
MKNDRSMCVTYRTYVLMLSKINEWHLKIIYFLIATMCLSELCAVYLHAKELFSH